MIKITKELLNEWFEHDNQWYFADELKKPNWVITNNRSRYGQFRPRTWTIEISTAYVRSERDYHNTFLHELCHLYVRQKYGYLVQHHGFEWKMIASRITSDTNGKYGTIKRIGGGQDKATLRSSKMYKYVVFTSKYGNLGIGKYTNDAYVSKLKNLNCIESGTDIYYFVSNDTEMNNYTLHKVNTMSVRWNKLGNLTLDEIKKRSTLISSEFYSTLQKVG